MSRVVSVYCAVIIALWSISNVSGLMSHRKVVITQLLHHSNWCVLDKWRYNLLKDVCTLVISVIYSYMCFGSWIISILLDSWSNKFWTLCLSRRMNYAYCRYLKWYVGSIYIYIYHFSRYKAKHVSYFALCYSE